MPVKIKGEKYYGTTEAAQIAGISRTTLLSWIDDGIFPDESRRDRRDWRLFTQSDVDRLQQHAARVK